MNSLERSLVEKAGYDSGFENIVSSSADEVILASARHPSKVSIFKVGSQYEVQLSSLKSATLHEELRRSFSDLTESGSSFLVPTEEQLAKLLRRAASLSQALPNQAAKDYKALLDEELKALPPEARGTEIERLVRQRVGQQSYRAAMMEYWAALARLQAYQYRLFLKRVMQSPGLSATPMMSA